MIDSKRDIEFDSETVIQKLKGCTIFLGAVRKEIPNLKRKKNSLFRIIIRTFYWKGRVAFISFLPEPCK